MTPHTSARSSMRERLLQLRAFTLVETVICIVITSVMLAAALSTVSAARVGMYKISERQRGDLLAQELMSEIMAQDYMEPEDTPAFGIEGAEVATSRAAWDDVDDYKTWSASPPQYKDGTTMSDLTGWTRMVTVARVQTGNLNQVVAVETGLKKITVTVSHNGTPIATRVALRSSAG